MARVILRRTVQKEPSTVPNTKYYVQIHGLYLFKSFYISEGLQIQNKYYNGWETQREKKESVGDSYGYVIMFKFLNWCLLSSYVCIYVQVKYKKIDVIIMIFIDIVILD